MSTTLKDKKTTILGIAVDGVTMEEALDRLEAFVHDRQPRLVATANAEMVMVAQDDPELFSILNSADLVLADGAGVVWAAKKLGSGVPERVAGYDLTQELLRRAAIAKHRIYWLGAAPGVAETAARRASELYPGIITTGIHDGFFFSEDPSIIRNIHEAKPDILLCALGVPKQEKWLDAHLKELGVPVSIGVGGTFDVMAGVMKRAPLWMQKAKLEWLFRGLLQPKRAGRLLALPRFVLKVHAYKK